MARRRRTALAAAAQVLSARRDLGAGLVPLVAAALTTVGLVAFQRRDVG